ncbi:MAG: MFS transporter [Paracoccaceae bacterium]|nr:MFS transporter [Paracoccaceae bacterium]
MDHARAGDRLPAYALFGATLAAAGLPIYIHAPKFYVDEYGVSLAALGAVLFGLRLLDVVQDPVLGWLSERSRAQRGGAVAVALAVLALSMIGLFAVTPPVAPLLWFGLTLTGLFSSFSFLTITFYAEGVEKAGRIEGGHVRLAAWRETGALLGVSLAAMAPTVLAFVWGAPFAAFAAAFAGLVLVAGFAMRPEWGMSRRTDPGPGIGTVLADPVARRLLLLALVNATPVAVSSTLFLFFVESRLEAPGWEGPLLLLFFLAAAGSAPLWAIAARRVGSRRALLSAMGLAIVTFGFALALGPGDTWPFALICLASGAALGADMTLLPAMFSRRMARIAPDAGQAFGLWNFVTKFTLAFAAVTLLPILDAVGFQSGSAASSDAALRTLTLLYAGVPCALKLIAIALLATLNMDDADQ